MGNWTESYLSALKKEMLHTNTGKLLEFYLKTSLKWSRVILHIPVPFIVSISMSDSGSCEKIINIFFVEDTSFNWKFVLFEHSRTVKGCKASKNWNPIQINCPPQLYWCKSVFSMISHSTLFPSSSLPSVSLTKLILLSSKNSFVWF